MTRIPISTKYILMHYVNMNKGNVQQKLLFNVWLLLALCSIVQATTYHGFGARQQHNRGDVRSGDVVMRAIQWPAKPAVYDESNTSGTWKQ